MTEDYSDSAQRHFHDAELLFKNGRTANADQLYGYSAECALKRLMQCCNDSQKIKWLHFPDLWYKIPLFAKGKLGSKYLAPIKSNPNPFNDWKIEQRYSHSSTITREQVVAHQLAARRIRGLLTKIHLDGGSNESR